MLSREQLQSASTQMGFPMDSLEKVWMLIRLLRGIASHPFLGPRVALKGGTALNLFLFDLPRLSVDIDINYIGTADRTHMMAERPIVEKALQQVTDRLGLTVKRHPSDHAGGKWRLSYMTALGRPGALEIDINFMLRVPLWSPTKMDSHTIAGEKAKAVPILDEHELAAGKLAALLARSASRDLFDSRELLLRPTLQIDKLRIAFVVYGGINRIDWRTASADSVQTTANDAQRLLLPMLRHNIRPEPADIEHWTETLIQETHDLLGKLLPLRKNEVAFLDQLNDAGKIAPDILTDDADLQERIQTNPGLRWKALNVKKHYSLS
jgi:predicted nucleotidyltransferase component of viral defense system